MLAGPGAAGACCGCFTFAAERACAFALFSLRANRLLLRVGGVAAVHAISPACLNWSHCTLIQSQLRGLFGLLAVSSRSAAKSLAEMDRVRSSSSHRVTRPR